MRKPTYLLRLYVSRSADRSIRAITNLQVLCEQYLRGRYVLEVVDVSNHADLARADQIVALPTLIKRRPLPFHRLVGDMSDPGKVLAGMGLEMRAR